MSMRDILSRFDGDAPSAFAPGENLIAEGRETGKLFVLKSGTIEIRRRGVLVTEIASLEAQPELALHVAMLLAERLERTTALVGRLKAGAAATPQRRSLVERVMRLLTGEAREAAANRRALP
jgi:hypothetical protein